MVFLAYFQTIYRDFSQDISSNKKTKIYRVLILTSGQYMIYFQTKSCFILDLYRRVRVCSERWGIQHSTFYFSEFICSTLRQGTFSILQLYLALIHPNPMMFFWIFTLFFRILTGSLATCLETSRGGAEFSKPYSEEEHQEEALLSVFTTWLVGSQAQWIAYWTHTFWPFQKKEEMLCLRSLLARPKIAWRL